MGSTVWPKPVQLRSCPISSDSRDKYCTIAYVFRSCIVVMQKVLGQPSTHGNLLEGLFRIARKSSVIPSWYWIGLLDSGWGYPRVVVRYPAEAYPVSSAERGVAIVLKINKAGMSNRFQRFPPFPLFRKRHLFCDCLNLHRIRRSLAEHDRPPLRDILVPTAMFFAVYENDPALGKC